MGLLYVLFSILGEAAAKTIDKLNFRRNRIAAKQLMLLVFIAMSASLTLYILLTHQPFPHFTPVLIGLVVSIALISFGSNVFDFLSLKSDDLSLREPLVDFQPIVAGLIGYMLFPAERKPGFLLAFLLGAVVVYWGTHRRKLRRLQKRGMSFLLLAICLESFLPSIYSVTLHHLSPVFIAFFRVVSVLILTSIFLPVRNLGKLAPKKVSYGLVSGVIYAGSAVASLYAIRELGVVLTMLLMLLGPFLHYFSGYFILKENVRKGELFSSFLLVIIVIVPLVR